ncbi:photosynthetic NDH subunit of subcomplex B 3, chloroplastic isoform X2 [Jatropha curcas]|uniref:photosynthetic NDH subunit of subcomplex B 3, chloroplastic isoform X2 n=1 Tax=Jatropha curcas TaxID=180498 RepID=UPI0005FC027F|nr:photosynthetic NDH subunit of subcomplex B 3, chloroplastic isoform X2 [Jatropha curcas]
MSTLQLNSYGIASLKAPHKSKYTTTHKTLRPLSHTNFSRIKIRAIGTVPDSKSDAKEPEEPPSVNFAFVHSVLLPDGTPDVHFRTSCGGKKLRDIMLDSNIELYGPYARPLLNCGGGGTCGTCMVEVIMGKELLNPRTDKEKKILKKVVIQQLPEWKNHEWKYEKILPAELLPQ